MTAPAPPLLLGLADAARCLSLAPESLRSYERRGLIHGLRIGRKLVFDVRDLQSFTDNLRAVGWVETLPQEQIRATRNRAGGQRVAPAAGPLPAQVVAK